MATLFSVMAFIPILWLAYTFRAWWVTRQDWHSFSPDVRAFYLLVAPPLAFALDLVMLSDRLFYWPKRVPVGYGE